MRAGLPEVQSPLAKTLPSWKEVENVIELGGGKKVLCKCFLCQGLRFQGERERDLSPPPLTGAPEAQNE